MKEYTAVVFYLDDHSTLIWHFRAERAQDWPAPSQDRSYLVVAVFAGTLPALDSQSVILSASTGN